MTRLGEVSREPAELEPPSELPPCGLQELELELEPEMEEFELEPAKPDLLPAEEMEAWERHTGLSAIPLTHTFFGVQPLASITPCLPLYVPPTTCTGEPAGSDLRSAIAQEAPRDYYIRYSTGTGAGTISDTTGYRDR